VLIVFNRLSSCENLRLDFTEIILAMGRGAKLPKIYDRFNRNKAFKFKRKLRLDFMENIFATRWGEKLHVIHDRFN
ncbi:MAG: hypothetical protein ACK560_07405, partial [Bacteroidota bacterium]